MAKRLPTGHPHRGTRRESKPAPRPSGHEVLRLAMTLGVLVGLAAPLASGCGDADAQERIELMMDDLPSSAGTDDRGVFQSVGWHEDPWQPFFGGVTLVLHHDLGRAPRVVLTYLSFSDTGAGAALAAGDMAKVVQSDERTVTLRNDTEAEFYCRVVLE